MAKEEALWQGERRWGDAGKELVVVAGLYVMASRRGVEKLNLRKLV